MKIQAGETAFCIPLVSEDLASLTEEIETLRQMSPDLAEWRVDYFTGSAEEMKKAFERIFSLREDGIGLIFTPRDRKEGGVRTISREERRMLAREAAAYGADYMDLEASMPQDERREIKRMLQGSQTRVIASRHDFERTLCEDGILSALEEARALGDLPKLAMMCRDEADFTAIRRAGLRFRSRHPQEPLILIGMGEAGVRGRIFPEEIGSNLSFASGAGSSAPGQVSLDEIRRARNGQKRPRLLFLTGMMGCGKSTIGRRLSEAAGWSFIDLDEEIVRRDGRSIPEIFDEEQEAGFRRIERQTLETLSDEMKDSGRSAVIATGGGCVIDDENRKTLRRLGRIVWLKADPGVIAKRIEGDESRPLLQGGDVLKKLETLLEKRRPFYEDCDLALENLEAEATVQALLDDIGRAGI